MKKFRVTINTCPYGHLRYGHYIGIVEAESEEELRRKLLSEDNEEVLDFLDFIVDDYEVEYTNLETYDIEHAEIAELTDKLEAPAEPAYSFPWHPIKDGLPPKAGAYVVTTKSLGGGLIVTTLDYSDKISPDVSDKVREDATFPNGFAFGDLWPDGLDSLDPYVIAWGYRAKPYNPEAES